MIKINAEQLATKLTQLQPSPDQLLCYLLIGTEPYLQHLAQSQLQKYLRTLEFAEQFIFTIDAHTDWNKIYDSCQALSLFSNRTLLILQFGENGVNAATTNKLNELVGQLTSDTSIIFSLPKLTKAQENSPWVKALSDHLLWVNCIAPDTSRLPQWLSQHAQQKELILDQPSIELLCYYYEGNLLALSQIIEQLKLLYPEGNISFAQVESNIDDSAVFTPYHWIDAILAGKSKRTLHILQQLKANDFEPLILLRTAQRELLLLINLKKCTVPIKAAFDQYKVWQNRRPLLTKILNRITLNQLYLSLNKLTQIEIALKQDYSTVIWRELDDFSLLLIGKAEQKSEPNDYVR